MSDHRVGRASSPQILQKNRIILNAGRSAARAVVGSKMIEKVVSGGQTGVDRAGLDAAMEAGIPVGGYCPKGRLSEDGTVPECYPLIELTCGGYPPALRRT